jgi:hypothetical protein
MLSLKRKRIKKGFLFQKDRRREKEKLGRDQKGVGTSSCRTQQPFSSNASHSA